MPNYLDAVTLQQWDSVSVVNAPTGPNIILQPDYSLVRGQPKKYWATPVLGGDGAVVQLKDAAARTQADADELAASVQADRDSTAADVDTRGQEGQRIRAEIHARNKRDNYLVNRIEELQNVITAMLNSTGGVANMRTDGLAVIPTGFMRTETQSLADARADFKGDVEAGQADV